MKKNKNLLLTLIVFIFFTIFFMSIYAIAIPIGPDILIRNSSSNFNNTLFQVKNTTAIAGNITQLEIGAITSTKSWAGFFGNITGEIFLQDARGFVFYNWTQHEPTGEIYASANSSVTWANIKCFNFTANGSSEINLTIVEDWFNITSYADDGFDITFPYTSNPSFYVGNVLIGANTCPTSYINQNNLSQTTNFPNMLLTDNSSLIFSTLIENSNPANSTDKPGYNGINYDFQLIVAEDGRSDFLNPTTTVYYFWVELD
ncbi:MAG: hypothetical protein QXG00_05310 [Candidatus Woesearchaeota archaeon]